jgi:phospholipid transport system substrate-binding protein
MPGGRTTMLRSRWLRTLVLTVALILAAVEARAGAPTDELQAQVDRVLKLLEDPQFRKEGKAVERRRAVRRIAEEIFDFEETARRSLGRHWAARTPAERQEFVGLFTDLLERAYISQIELYRGERIMYLNDSVDGDQASVRTRLITRQGAEVPIDYRMLRKGTRWHIYDVSVEGVSLVANYRSQFNKIIQTSSYQELVKKLKVRQEEYQAEIRQRKS